MIDTRRVQRRTLRFESLADAIREAQRLADIDRDGRLEQRGNWSLGTALHHLGAWASYPFVGYPPPVQRIPGFVRFVAKAMKARILRKPMGPGMRIGGTADGTLASEPATTDAGLVEMRTAFERLDRQAPQRPNPALGPLTHAEWKDLNLRHAELHLGFFAERG